MRNCSARWSTSRCSTGTRPDIGPMARNAGSGRSWRRHSFFYSMATSRGSDVLQRLLGAAFRGVLGSDRLSTYLTYAAERRQLCWSHLRSNLLSAQELATTPSATRFCRDALGLQRQLFRLWYRFRGDPHVRGAPLTRAQLIAN